MADRRDESTATTGVPVHLSARPGQIILTTIPTAITATTRSKPARESIVS